jgi:phosphoglycolate phosphatase-like HAD superfamily hydrolase
MLIKTNPTTLAYIFDVDGTLANVDPYLHHVRGANRDYDAFHESSIDALPNFEVVEMLNQAFFDQRDVIIVTSRKEKWRGLTSRWLAKNDIGHHALYMRKDDDNRPDYEVKRDILLQIKKHWNVIHAVDDNPSVIKLWEDHGITTTKIGTWDGSKT